MRLLQCSALFLRMLPQLEAVGRLSWVYSLGGAGAGPGAGVLMAVFTFISSGPDWGVDTVELEVELEEVVELDVEVEVEVEVAVEMMELVGLMVARC